MILFFKKLFYILLLSFIIVLHSFNLEYFRGYSDDVNEPVYSIESLLKLKYVTNEKCNENYFHEAQFPDLGITIFTNIIFSKTFMDKNDCKLHCIITFKDKERYVFNEDFNKENFYSSNDKFNIRFGSKCYIKYENNIYRMHIENNKLSLNLNYEVVSPPQIFGDGIISINSRNYLGFSWPVVGAKVHGALNYNNEKITLKGRGSIGHDYSHVAPINNPRKWRSFWFYNDKYTVHVHTIVLTDGSQIDRVAIYKDNKLVKYFLNSGLIQSDYIKDNNNFSYPTQFIINFTDEKNDTIRASIQLKGITDRIQAFAHLTPTVHKIAAMAVGEMWAYRFWSVMHISFTINGINESIRITGIGNYVDTDKGQ
ncbi:MAG: hypothetical protein JXB50_05030 [Spirochaetes bacterium]|nr:hypothetical protein [Spirochaetota bacterium]